MSFGWYYEESSTRDEDDDVWALIGRAVPEAAEEGRLDRLMVGEMVDSCVTELLDSEDVVSLSDHGNLTADDLVELIDERHGERVYDGTAALASAEAKPALRRIIQAHRCAEDAASDVIAWACEHVTLDPAISCHGRHPLPIEFIEGEWYWGSDSDHEPSAVITYATEPSPETGYVGWCWWALGDMGDAASYDDARRKAEASLRRRVGI